MFKTDISTLPIPYSDNTIDAIEIQDDSDSDSDDLTDKKLNRILMNKKIEDKLFNFETKKKEYVCVVDSSARNTSNFPNVSKLCIDLDRTYYNVVSMEVIKASIDQSEFLIDSRNCFIDWIEMDSITRQETSVYSAQIPHGDYSIDELLNILEKVMNGNENLPIVYYENGVKKYGGNSTTFVIELDNSELNNTDINMNKNRNIVNIKFKENNSTDLKTDRFKLLFGTGPNRTNSISKIIGFNYDDTEYSGDSTQHRLFIREEGDDRYLIGSNTNDDNNNNIIIDDNKKNNMSWLFNTEISSVQKTSLPTPIISDFDFLLLKDMYGDRKIEIEIFKNNMRFKSKTYVIDFIRNDTKEHIISFIGNIENIESIDVDYIVSLKNMGSNEVFTFDIERIKSINTIDFIEINYIDNIKENFLKTINNNKTYINTSIFKKKEEIEIFRVFKFDNSTFIDNSIKNSTIASYPDKLKRIYNSFLDTEFFSKENNNEYFIREEENNNKINNTYRPSILKKDGNKWFGFYIIEGDVPSTDSTLYWYPNTKYFTSSCVTKDIADIADTETNSVYLNLPEYFLLVKRDINNWETITETDDGVDFNFLSFTSNDVHIKDTDSTIVYVYKTGSKIIYYQSLDDIDTGNLYTIYPYPEEIIHRKTLFPYPEMFIKLIYKNGSVTNTEIGYDIYDIDDNEITLTSEFLYRDNNTLNSGAYIETIYYTNHNIIDNYYIFKQNNSNYYLKNSTNRNDYIPPTLTTILADIANINETITLNYGNDMEVITIYDFINSNYNLVEKEIDYLITYEKNSYIETKVNLLEIDNIYYVTGLLGRPDKFTKKWEDTDHIIVFQNPNNIDSTVISHIDKSISLLYASYEGAYNDFGLFSIYNGNVIFNDINDINKDFSIYLQNSFLTGFINTKELFSTGIEHVFIEKKEDKNYMYSTINFNNDYNKKIIKIKNENYYLRLNIENTELNKCYLSNYTELDSLLRNNIESLNFLLYKNRNILSTSSYNLSKSKSVIIDVEELNSLQLSKCCCYFFNQRYIPPPIRTFRPIPKLTKIHINMLRSSRYINEFGSLDVNTSGDHYEFNGNDYTLVFNITCMERVDERLKTNILHS